MSDDKISTEGGATIGEDVNIDGGDFIGRDKISKIITVNGHIIVAVAALFVLGLITALVVIKSDVKTAPVTEVGLAATPLLTSEQEVLSVISAELKGALNQDLTLLRSLYASNAVIVDRRQTIDPTDDIWWEGWSAIERRYRETFFPLNFRSFSHDQLSVNITSDIATVTAKGAIADGEYIQDTGVFTLEKRDGKWVITKLVYGIPK